MNYPLSSEVCRRMNAKSLRDDLYWIEQQTSFSSNKLARLPDCKVDIMFV